MNFLFYKTIFLSPYAYHLINGQGEKKDPYNNQENPLTKAIFIYFIILLFCY